MQKKTSIMLSYSELIMITNEQITRLEINEAHIWNNIFIDINIDIS